MDISIYLARVFGIYLIIVTIAAFVNRDHFKKLLEDFSKNTSLIFFSGIVNLILGLFVVVAHNIWTNDWRIIITLIGFAGVVKGILRIMFPYKVAGWLTRMGSQKTMIMWGITMLLFGIFLTYISFS